jgi:hypothetical protein
MRAQLEIGGFYDLKAIELIEGRVYLMAIRIFRA